MRLIKTARIGNDYVYVDCFRELVSEPGEIGCPDQRSALWGRRGWADSDHALRSGRCPYAHV